MAPILEYPEARERWTWKRQVMHDDRTKILSELRVQQKDECAYVAIVTTLEPNLKVQRQRSVSLSIPHLISLDQVSRTRLPTEAGKIRRLLLVLRVVGILEEGQYMNVLQGTLGEEEARRYKIIKFYHYELDKLDHIEHALYQLRGGGPLLAVIRISENYKECQNSGMIYRFDPNMIVEDDNKVPETRCLCGVFCYRGQGAMLRVSRLSRPGFW